MQANIKKLHVSHLTN